MNTETNQYTIANQKHYAIKHYAKWQTFKEIIESKINCNIPLKTPEQIEQAVATLTATIQEAAWTTTTPEPTSRQTITIPQEILDKIKKKEKQKHNGKNTEPEKTKNI